MKKIFVKAMTLAIASLIAVFSLTQCKDGNDITGNEEITALLPSLGTVEVTNITTSSATISVTVTYDNGVPLSECGLIIGADKIQYTDKIDKTISLTIGNLKPNSSYPVKGYAINKAGTAYSKESSFQTLIEVVRHVVKDIDGNEYDTIRIGKQTWMVQNLKVKHYRDGSAIPIVTDNTAWVALKSGAMCYYDNNVANESLYGALYNGYASQNPKGIAPVGWHVATYPDWQILGEYLGGNHIAGLHLKEVGTVHWLAPNKNVDNSSGFTALPGGIRDWVTGNFKWINETARWWSINDGSLPQLPGGVKDACVDNEHSSLYISNNDIYDTVGYAIRCIKNK